jgi:hypothetical protein
MAADDREKSSREPFVAQGDRPEVRLNPDAPLSELRVRDLATILGLGSRKDFWDGKDWQKDDFDGPIGPPKPWKEGKEIKDFKEWKEKPEKLEKREIKEYKLEKIESDGVFDPGITPRPDPRIEQVIQHLSGLSTRVGELANQVEELKKRSK